MRSSRSTQPTGFDRGQRGPAMIGGREGRLQRLPDGGGVFVVEGREGSTPPEGAHAAVHFSGGLVKWFFFLALSSPIVVMVGHLLGLWGVM